MENYVIQLSKLKATLNEETTYHVLRDTFNNVNEWLRYSERKNAYLFTALGIQITLLKVFDSTFEKNVFFIFSVVFLGVSFLLTMMTFLPKTKFSKTILFWSESNDRPDQSDNLLFYGDTVKYSVNGYINALTEKYKFTIKGNKHFEDLCNQIVVNSGIADRKFKSFVGIFYVMLAGQFLLVLSLLT